MLAVINREGTLEKDFTNVVALVLDCYPLFDLTFLLKLLKLESCASNNLITSGATIVTLEVDAFIKVGHFNIEDLVPLGLKSCLVHRLSL